MLIATLLSAPLALTPLVSSAAATLALLFLATFAAGGFIMLAVAFATRVYSSASSALLSGLGSAAWSGLVALVMPSFGRLLDLHRYGLAFAIVAACPAAGFAVWSALRRRVRLRAPRSELAWVPLPAPSSATSWARTAIATTGRITTTTIVGCRAAPTGIDRPII